MDTLRARILAIYNANVDVRNADPSLEFVQMVRDEMDAVWDAITAIADHIDASSAKD
ncbi:MULTISPECIES: hypothetical protein [Microbacterium]|uniref:Uncharacterized protein n=1 Tax=Microbacterium phage vB_MoxS-R1 TaxID=2848881 RepID=A0A8F2IVF0_9CAUD|nr:MULTISPECIES: hypothetical protein [Microbacterium]YP_010649889.1 hypothetical protein PP419_gp09 [Microbacterium phage vB_MoxS-R1]MBE7953585.1 hypothetical protein [Microbacterium sp. R1]QWT28859.1 hypothetical protein vBMoxSR1_gp9 [Microbacterium phage vB_MoxS-R1]GED39134.1 hypothetical protein MOX01_22760 [Microbacterium oxydans]